MIEDRFQIFRKIKSRHVSTFSADSRAVIRGLFSSHATLCVARNIVTAVLRSCKTNYPRRKERKGVP